MSKRFGLLILVVLLLATFATAQQQSTSKTITITVAPSALTVTTSSLPSAQVGVAYSATLSASGGTPPYSWTASGLPAGLTLSSGGVLSGTPTAQGSYSTIFTVTDSGTAAAAVTVKH